MTIRAPFAALAAILVTASGGARAADVETFDLVVHTYCRAAFNSDPSRLVCGRGNEAWFKRDIMKAVQEMNLSFCANGIMFRYIDTPVVYDLNHSFTTFDNGGPIADQSYQGTFGGENVYELRQMAAQDPTRVHAFVLDSLDAGFSPIPELGAQAGYENVWQGIFVGSWLPGGGWAHEMGHHFGLHHTHRPEDRAEVGGTPDYDLDGLACTPPDPGPPELAPEPPNLLDAIPVLGALVANVGQEFCEYEVVEDPSVDDGSPLTSYCTVRCVENLGGGTQLSAAAPAHWNVMSYYPAECQGPYIREGTLHPGFCGDQANIAQFIRANFPERQALVPVCAGSGDSDCDGVCQDVDTCPDTPNVDQSDIDGDGIGNGCDLCVKVPAPAGQPHGDIDGDGIGDECDYDIDGDGCPQRCGQVDPNCPVDLEPYEYRTAAGTVVHPLCPGGQVETLWSYGWHDADGDGTPNCADADDDNDRQKDWYDPCPIHADDQCEFIGTPCTPEVTWRETCGFGGCDRFGLELLALANPAPSERVVFASVEAQGDTLYVRPPHGMALSEMAGLLTPGAGEAYALVLTDPDSGQLVATVAEWDAAGLALGNLTQGTFLTLTPSTALGAGLAAAASAALTVGATYQVGAPPGAPLRDSDGDSLPDNVDVCRLVADPAQRDADGDGIGDACDPDLDQDFRVSKDDLALLAECGGVDLAAIPPLFETLAARPEGFSPAAELQRQRCRPADLNGDRVVDAADLDLATPFVGGPTGPSGRAEIPVRAQSRAQQRCINTLNHRLARLARSSHTQLARCVHRAARGQLVDGLAACAAGSEDDALAKAVAATARKEARLCAADPPDFAASAAPVLERAVRADGLRLIGAVFGADPDAALVPPSRGTRDAFACQQESWNAALRCRDIRLAEFNRCTQAGLASGAIQHVVDLAACLESDPEGRIATQCDPASGRLGRDIERGCADPGTELAALFPGCAAEHGAALAACLDRTVRCGVCEMLDRADALAADCRASCS